MPPSDRHLDTTGIFRDRGPRDPKRVTAGIMFADIAGYSTMMQADEAGALRARRIYRAALDEAVAANGGVVVQHYGDGSLSIFRSAGQAAQAAVAMQRRLQGDPQVPVRIGIHFDATVRDGEGIYGNGVNVTARIQSLCPPGAVLLSDRVALELHGEPLQPISMGTYQLKNIQDPVMVHALDDPAIVRPTPHQLRSTSAVQLAPAGYPRPLDRAPGRLVTLIWELKRRKVDRVALGYCASSLVLVAILELAVTTTGLSDILLDAATIAIFAGFPGAVVVSWVFDLAPGWLLVTPPSRSVRPPPPDRPHHVRPGR